jgi:hypothetical protein
MLLDLLMISNIAVPIMCIIGFCHNDKGFIIDHVFILSAGFIFYWILPVCIYYFGFFISPFSLSQSAISASYGVTYINLTRILQLQYLIITSGIYTSFIIGHILSVRMRIIYFRINHFSLKPLKYLAFVYLAFLILLTVGHYGYLFKGYTKEVFTLKGNIITLNILILTVLMMYFTLLDKSSKFRNIFHNYIFYLYLICTILLASLGNRTWIICGILSFFIIYTNYYKRIPIKWAGLGLALLVVVVATSAQYRTGNFTSIPTDRIISLALHDTFVIHLGLKDYLSNNDINLFNFPIVLVSKLYKIIPTLIMPNKAEMYYTYSDIGVNFFSVQAAWHSFGTLMTHFGAVGSMLLSFILPFIMNYLKNSIYLKASFIVITAHFAAPFFRDFDDFIIKIVLQICIIMPLIYLLICNIYPKITNKL